MCVLHVLTLTTPCCHETLQLSQSCNTHTHNEHSHTHSDTPCLMVCECVNAENLYKLSFPSYSAHRPSPCPCVSSLLGPARRLHLYLNTHTHTLLDKANFHSMTACTHKRSGVPTCCANTEKCEGKHNQTGLDLDYVEWKEFRKERFRTKCV